MDLRTQPTRFSGRDSAHVAVTSSKKAPKNWPPRRKDWQAIQQCYCGYDEREQRCRFVILEPVPLVLLHYRSKHGRPTRGPSRVAKRATEREKSRYRSPVGMMQASVEPSVPSVPSWNGFSTPYLTIKLKP